MSLISNAMARLADLFDFNQISNRNLIVDGNKDVWNAASAFTCGATLTYSYNVMYKVCVGAGGAGTYQIGNIALGSYSNYGYAPCAKYYGALTVTTASTGTLAALTTPMIAVLMEGVNTAAGQSVTLSMWLFTFSGTVNVTQAWAIQTFGSGGSPSANINTLVPVNWVVNTVPKRFSVRIDLPSIVGKTLGTAGNDYVLMGLSFPPGLTYTICDVQWQLEVCSPQAPAAGLPTAFEYRGLQSELVRIYRYYEASALPGLFSGNVSSGGTYFSNSYFKTAKRTTPSVTLTTAGSPSSFPTTISLASSQPDGILVSALANANNPGIFQYNWIADARL